MSSIPSIACLGVIGKNNNPLHISIFPTSFPLSTSTSTSNTPIPTTIRTPLQFSLLLSSTLDIFESRSKTHSASNSGLSGDYGLLHAIDERLAAYGYETNTGVRFVVVVDMRGRSSMPGGGGVGGNLGGGGGGVGIREGEMKVVFRAMQAAYVRLLQNPFFDPDEHSPPTGRGGKKISSKLFADDMRRIGESWMPGVANA